MKKWKMSKIVKTPKCPKCQINGQNRHFVNSEPPGPAFFEFQGVPRDPILRPKTGVHILNVKSDIYHFPFYAFSRFHVLCISCELTFSSFCGKWHFCDDLCYWLKALLHYIRGRYDVSVVVLPSLGVRLNAVCFFVKDVGEKHRRGERIINSRSPLSEPSWVIGNWRGYLCVGEIHRRGDV